MFSASKTEVPLSLRKGPELDTENLPVFSPVSASFYTSASSVSLDHRTYIDHFQLLIII